MRFFCWIIRAICCISYLFEHLPLPRNESIVVKRARSCGVKNIVQQDMGWGLLHGQSNLLRWNTDFGARHRFFFVRIGMQNKRQKVLHVQLFRCFHVLVLYTSIRYGLFLILFLRKSDY